MSQPPALHVSHRVRVSILEKEVTWTLRDHDLLIESGDSAASVIPLTWLNRITLRYDPTRVQTRRFRCFLQLQDGRNLILQNEHYCSLASFEDRSGSYRHLVTAICQRTAAANPACLFITGKSPISYWAQLIGLALMFVLLAIMLVVMWTVIGWLSIMQLIVIAFMLPIVIRWARKNRPGRFDPMNPPAILLPEIPQS